VLYLLNPGHRTKSQPLAGGLTGSLPDGTILAAQNEADLSTSWPTGTDKDRPGSDSWRSDGPAISPYAPSWTH
jgi:hypothetical protein